MYGQVPSYLTERFPTEVRATATGFCYHAGAIPGALVPPILTYFATTLESGVRDPDADRRRCSGLANFILALLLGPETRGNRNVPDLVVA